MKTDFDIDAAVAELIESLRHELQECGEMLALLDQQQESVMARAAEDVLRSAAAVGAQMANIQSARARRDGQRAGLAQSLGLPESAPFAELTPVLPPKFRIPVESLVRGNNELLTRVQRRARQNHLLLGRSLQLMQQLIDGLMPALGPTTYNDTGTVAPLGQRAKGVYEAVG